MSADGVTWTGSSCASPDAWDWWSALATDRSLYRTTDTVDAWGYLRSRTGRLPSTVELRVWRDTDGPRTGRPIVAATARRASTGAFAATLKLRDLPYGSYLLESLADGRSIEIIGFEVGDVRKPPFQLTLAASPRAVVADTPVRATVTARFFDGTPVAQLPVVVSAQELERRPGVDDFSGEVVEHRTTTNVAGTATARVMPRVLGDWNQEMCENISASPSAAVEAQSDGSRRICVYRAAAYIDAAAVREGAAIIVTGAVHEVDLASVASQLVRADRESDRWSEIEPRGDPIAGRRVRVEVTEQVLRRVVTSRWYDPITKEVREEYQSEVVRETTTRHTATTRADGTFRLRLAAPARDRAWNIRAVVQDAAGRETFTRASVEAAPTGREATGYVLQLRGTTHQFAVGAAVRAEVSTWGSPATRLAPAGGANRFLFLVTSPGRFEALVRGSPTVSTRFRTADEPNLRITAIWFTGKGYVLPGAVDAWLDTGTRRINVSLTTDRERYEPGQPATITIRTTNRAGRPVPATVLLRGIDEKLVAMGAADLADPLELLYREVPVGLRDGPAISHRVWLPGPDGGGGSTTGGGGDGRVDLRDTLPLQMVTTSAAGTARVTYHLPDDVTSWRVGAAAVTGDRRAGQAIVRLPVGLPFFVDATIAPEYLVADRVSIRLRAYGSALASGAAVRFTVSSPTLAMAPVVVAGRAFTEALVSLPALGEGTHRVVISATSAAGSDRLERTFTVVASRLTAGHRETIAIAGPIAPPGGAGVTRLVISDAGRARYLHTLLDLATPRGQRADERLASTLARDVLGSAFDVGADELPPAVTFERSAYQRPEGGLALLPYGSADLELTVRALVADPDALLAASVRPWLRDIANDLDASLERRTVAQVGLAALGDPVLGELVAAAERTDAGDRVRLWAALGLGLLGDTGRATAVERSLLERWGERRGDQVRLRISGDAEEVSEATDLTALLAAVVGDPVATDLLGYVGAVPPRDTLAALTHVSVIGRLVERLATARAVVAVVRDGIRERIEIPAGGSVSLELVPSQRAGMRIEPVSGAAAMTASWEEATPAAARLGDPDPDLRLTRTITKSPIAASRVVTVVLRLKIGGPGRDGTSEVVDLVPSGLVATGGIYVKASGCSGDYTIGPRRIEGQRVVFVVDYYARTGEDDQAPTVPGTFCLAYAARVVTAGTYAWQPAVARQATSPGLVATTPSGKVELR